MFENSKFYFLANFNQKSYIKEFEAVIKKFSVLAFVESSMLIRMKTQNSLVSKL